MGAVADFAPSLPMLESFSLPAVEDAERGGHGTDACLR